jgi:hypothetical protein
MFTIHKYTILYAALRSRQSILLITSQLLAGRDEDAAGVAGGLRPDVCLRGKFGELLGVRLPRRL